MATHFYKQFMIEKWVIMNFSRDLPVVHLLDNTNTKELESNFGVHFPTVLKKKQAHKLSQCSQFAMIG